MSTGKETPRQKMISLMYLVLIAMLALQVSSTVIFKFEQLNENLEISNAETTQNNTFTLGKIGQEVHSKKRPGKQLEYLKKADEIRKRTSTLSKFMQDIKTELISETGGYDEKGNLKGAKEETKVEVLMLGSTNNGKAYTLKKKLDQHISWLNSLGLGKYESIAQDAKNHPKYRNKPDQVNKDFANLNFSNAPLVAALATISELENSILSIERVILGSIAENIHLQDYKVGQLIPMVKTNSNYVVAGKNYEANLFLSAQLASETPEMYLGNTSLKIDENGMGKINFKVQGGAYGDDGTLKKSWVGKIKVKKPDGSDTTYTIEQEYIVAKPTLQFQAASVQSLYYNCGNNMNLSVPELGLEFNPSYKVEGGKLEQGNTRGNFVILPTSNKVKVKVSTDGIYIGEKVFNVKKVPLPRIEVKKGIQPINPQRGISSSEIKSLRFIVTPDQNFEEFLPKDAQYKITKWEATLANGSRRKGSSINSSGHNLRSIYSEFREAKTGDRIILEIKELKRLNYKGAQEVVKLPQSERFITIPIS